MKYLKNAYRKATLEPETPKKPKAKKAKRASAQSAKSPTTKTLKGKSSPSSRNRGGAIANQLLDQAVGRVKRSMNKKR